MDMEDYLFVLGRDKELSLLELMCYFNRKSISYAIKDRWANFIIASLSSSNFNIEELGGIIKIAKIIFRFKDKKELTSSLNSLEIPNKNKVYYSVNHNLIKEILAKKFKDEQIKAYHKCNVDDPTSSRKLDFELINFKDYLAKVIQVSNPKLYKKRDELRPRFDEKKVTSIRLAKILINLSQAKKEVFDPFCGAGTILQEALLMNLDVYGLDTNIDEAKENLAWLTKNFNIKNKIKLFQGDARNLRNFIKNIEVVVTEPYLGPYLKDYLEHNKAKILMSKLELLYKKVFSELNKITKKIVIIFPVIPTKNNKKITVNVDFILKNTNFKLKEYSRIKLPILYMHKGSILEREIWIFDKN
jgi:tRNA G10  N-methylase Trm11